MTKWAFAFIILLITSPIWAQSSRFAVSDASDFNVQWKTSLSNQNLTAEEAQSSLVVWKFDARVSYLLDEDLNLIFAPQLYLQSGSSQYNDTVSHPDNKLILRHAAIDWKPFEEFEVEAGALNQGSHHTPTLMDSRAFPSVAFSIWPLGAHSINEWQTRFGLDFAIPTSTSLSTNTADLEPTPSFNSLRFEVLRKIKNRTLFQWMIGGFQFQNLPSAIAQESSLLGNTVDHPSATKSLFKNKFQGFETALNFELFLFSRLSLFSKNAGHQNTQAPKEYNTAWTTENGIRWHLGTQTDMDLSGEVFHIEPDASVASFVDTDFHETNINGYSGKLKLSLRDNKYRLIFRAGESDSIFINSPQGRERFILLKLEVGHVDL